MNDRESSSAVERLARSAKADWRTALRRARPFLAIALIVILLDQVTKAIVRAGLDRGESWPEGWWVQITHVTNTGAAFGILEGETALLAVTSVVGIVAVVVYFLSPPIEHWLLGPALGLVLGGAIGNLIDRVRLGRVTDFIDFPHYPKFNVADSSITVGIIGLVIMLILATEPSDGDEQEDPSSDS